MGLPIRSSTRPPPAARWIHEGIERGVQIDAELSYGQGLEFGSIPRADRPGSFSPQSGDGGAGAAAGASGATGASAPVFSVPVPVPTPVVFRSPQGSYLRLTLRRQAGSAPGFSAGSRCCFRISGFIKRARSQRRVVLSVGWGSGSRAARGRIDPDPAGARNRVANLETFWLEQV